MKKIMLGLAAAFALASFAAPVRAEEEKPAAEKPAKKAKKAKKEKAGDEAGKGEKKAE
jgi:hypothetical protein